MKNCIKKVIINWLLDEDLEDDALQGHLKLFTRDNTVKAVGKQ